MSSCRYADEAHDLTVQLHIMILHANIVIQHALIQLAGALVSVQRSLIKKLSSTYASMYDYYCYDQNWDEFMQSTIRTLYIFEENNSKTVGGTLNGNF